MLRMGVELCRTCEIDENTAWASSKPRFLSGCHLRASTRYALMIWLLPALFSTPMMEYGSPLGGASQSPPPPVLWQLTVSSSAITTQSHRVQAHAFRIRGGVAQADPSRPGTHT